MNNEEDQPLSLEQAMRSIATKKKGNYKKLYSYENGEVVVDHVETANVLMKLIMVTPMDERIKEILVRRIGNPLLNQQSLSHLQIAIELAIPESLVRALEIEGIKIAKAFMNRVCTQDAVNKFNKENMYEKDAKKKLKIR